VEVEVDHELPVKHYAIGLDKNVISNRIIAQDNQNNEEQIILIFIAMCSPDGA